MKVSREQVGENRRRILDEAGRLFRARGFEAVTVAEVMKAAGLTHGAFYGHFPSKDDLIAQTLGHVLGQAEVGDELQPFVDFYLSPHHCDDLAGGCPTAGLGADAIRQSPQARQAMTEGLRRHLQHMTRMQSAPDEVTRRRILVDNPAKLYGFE